MKILISEIEVERDTADALPTDTFTMITNDN